MSQLETLLETARKDATIIVLKPDAAEGAESYFRAYRHIATMNSRFRPSVVRALAATFLTMTANPPLDAEQQEGADVARKTLKQLSQVK